MTEKITKCRACNGRGYHRCECWPGDCICGYGDETCEECAGDGFIDPSFDDVNQIFESPSPSTHTERDYPAEFETWWETYRHKNRDPADYSVKKQIAFDAFYFGVQTPSPETRMGGSESDGPTYLDFITPDEIFDKGPAAVNEWQQAKLVSLRSEAFE